MRSADGGFVLRVIRAIFRFVHRRGRRWSLARAPFHPFASATRHLIARRAARLAALAVGVVIASGGGLLWAVSAGGAAPVRASGVDAGHESAAVQRELENELPAPGPRVDQAGGRGGTGAAPSPAGRLVSDLSTAFSDTWQPQRGPRVTRIFAAPVNYRDSRGAWVPIANQLVASSGGYSNEANAFSLHVPDSLGSPVSLSSAGRSLAFKLEGAAGSASISGDDATFKRALPSVDMTYHSQANGVSELATLTDSSAPTSLRFDLAASPGLVARQLSDGMVELVDGSGGVRFAIPPAVAYRPGAGVGSPRVLSSSLSSAGSGWVLTVDTSVAWLRSLLASGPVVVDPTVTVGSASDCSIDQNAPTWNACTDTQVWEGYDSPDLLRSLLQFSLSSVPAGSQILNAQLGLYVQSTTSTSSKAVGVYRMTRAWTTGVTWNTYDGTHSWSAPGGDFSTGSDAVVNPSVGGSTGWVYWYPTEMVQEWMDGTGTDADPAGYANDGLIVKDQSEGSVSNEVAFASQYASSDQPYLQIAYEPRGYGDGSQYTELSTPLTDKMTMSVNPASGNLMLAVNDFHVQGTADSVYDATHTYNSLYPELGDYAYDWVDSNGEWLSFWNDGSVSFLDGSGEWFTFMKLSSGAYSPPPGIKAILCSSGSPAPCPSSYPSGINYELIYDQSHETLEFDGSYLQKTLDKYGNSVSIAYNEGNIDTITDSQGRQFGYAWSQFGGNIEGINSIHDDAGGRGVGFGYTANGAYEDLTSSVDADGNTTSYGYSPYDYLDEITTPKGNEVLLTYDGTGQVTSITRVTNPTSGTGPETKYAYYGFGAGTSYGCTSSQKATVVTDPDGVDGDSGHTTTYCSNADDEVELVVDANGEKTTNTFDQWGNTLSSTAAVRGGSGSAGITSDVYDSTGQNLNCVITGTTSVQTSCPSGGLSLGYSERFAYVDTTYPYYPTQLTDPQQNTDKICYYGGSNACAGGGSGFSGTNGALKQQTDQLSSQNSLDYNYNSNGTISSSTDADGNVTTYGYDSNGNLNSITPPSSSGLGKETITNDADSRPYIITQCLSGSSCSTSETATITYDSDDRITKIVYTGPASTTTIQYNNDKDGNLYQLTDPHGTTTYTVDDLNRITNESAPGSVSYSYAWDDASNLTCFTDSGGNTTYIYNGLNELTDMYEKDSSCGAKTSSLHSTFGYDNDHSLTKITYPSGVNINYGLDPTTGRITSVTTKNSSGTTLHSDAYTYTNGSDDTALIQTLTDTVGSSTDDASYTYDPLNRLTTATTTGASPSYYYYQLDGNGNRQWQTVNTSGSGTTGATTTYYDYNAGNQLLCRMNTNAACSNNSSTELSGYSYDQAGNQLGITAYNDPSSTTFAYNNANQLTTLTPPSTSAETLSYLGDGQDDLTGIGSGITLQNGLLGTTEQTNSSGTSYYARTPSGLLIDERLPGGTDYNPVYDAQGDITGLTNSTGSLIQTVSYGPYGENANATGSLSYSTTNDPFLYKGGYHLAGGNSGLGNIPNQLYHYGQRYFDPTSGRWTQTDPRSLILDEAQANRYNYAADDPVNLSDSSGELSVLQACRVGLSVLSACAAFNSPYQDLEPQPVRTVSQLVSDFSDVGSDLIDTADGGDPDVLSQAEDLLGSL